MTQLQRQSGRNTQTLFRALVVPTVIAMLVVGCGSDDGGSTAPTNAASSGDTSTAPTDAAAADTVSIKDFAFDPPQLTVPVGTTVVWMNDDSTDHTVTADDGAFDGGTLARGDTFSFTFSSADSFPYHCSIHPNMTASITVTD